MTQITMSLSTGNSMSGTWTASVPNPVASMPGASATIYYVIVAQDDDDTMGNCDHRTQVPTRMSFEMTVTASGGGGGGTTLALCQSCTADSQCGDSDDNCIRIGTTSGSYCGTSCSAGSGCPSGYVCSTNSITSVSGGSGRQCVPSSGTCSSGGGMPPPSSCMDAYEPNDTRTVAAGRAALAPGTYSNLKICPLSGGSAYEDDWYKIDLTSSSNVTAGIMGGSASDLDLSLVGSDGTALAQSTSLSSNESVTQCLAAGTYYIRVYGWLPAGSTASASNTYSLTWSRATGSCSSGSSGSLTCGDTCPSWLDYNGMCDAGAVKWCELGTVRCQTCGSGESCQLSDYWGWYTCSSSTPTAVCGGECGSITFDGECNGDQLRYCSSGTLICSDCTGGCGYDSTYGYYACTSSSSSLTCGSACPEWLTSTGTCESTTSLKYCASGSVVCESCDVGTLCEWDYANNWYGCISDGGI
jgi:hypothetical protein